MKKNRPNRCVCWLHYLAVMISVDHLCLVSQIVQRTTVCNSWHLKNVHFPTNRIFRWKEELVKNRPCIGKQRSEEQHSSSVWHCFPMLMHSPWSASFVEEKLGIKHNIEQQTRKNISKTDVVRKESRSAMEIKFFILTISFASIN